MFKITAVLKDIANYLASISSYQREISGKLSDIEKYFRINSGSNFTHVHPEYERKKEGIINWRVEDKNGRIVKVRADSFNYINNGLAWFYIGNDKVASFDSPISINKFPGESK